MTLKYSIHNCSRKPVTGSYPQLNYSSIWSHILIFWYTILILSSHLRLGIHRGLLRFSQQISLRISILLPMHTVRPAHLVKNYCVAWDSPNLEGKVPVFISARNMCPSYTPGHWIPFLSQGSRWRYCNPPPHGVTSTGQSSSAKYGRYRPNRKHWPRVPLLCLEREREESWGVVVRDYRLEGGVIET
jgi:hypothetical protein